VATIEKRAFKFVPESLNGVRAGQVAPLALGDSHLLVFVNGRHAPGLSRLGRLPSGADVGSLAQAVAKRPDRFEALLTRDAKALVNGFTALNAAFWADGATIQPERPLHAIEDMCSHEAETLSGGEVRARRSFARAKARTLRFSPARHSHRPRTNRWQRSRCASRAAWSG
jgi:hypothetical protein